MLLMEFKYAFIFTRTGNISYELGTMALTFSLIVYIPTDPNVIFAIQLETIICILTGMLVHCLYNQQTMIYKLLSAFFTSM